VRNAAALLAPLLLALPACAAAPKPYDYGPFLDHMPLSVLVLPPLNESPEVGASYCLLAAMPRALAERGYYVFPPAVVDALLKENGLPGPGEMHQVPVQRLAEVTGADAVLYLTIRQWGTRYVVIDSSTILSVEGRLVDARSGTEIWSGTAGVADSSSSGRHDNLASLLVAALVTQVVHTAADRAHELAPAAAGGLVGSPGRGFLLGPRHAGFEVDQGARREERARLAAASGAEAPARAGEAVPRP